MSWQVVDFFAFFAPLREKKSRAKAQRTQREED
jgi:hypothetical protein